MMGPSRFETAKRVTIVNAAINTLLAFLKVLIGYLGHSHALISDGIHSFSDLITDTLVFIAAKIGGKIPDADHPYGHQRIETLAAIMIALLLLTVGGTIIYETYRHTQQGQPTPIHGLPVILAALISVALKEGLFRYTLKMGRKIHSNLLITNAWHNRSDVWVSALVVVSVMANLAGIPYADNMGAAIIALVIIKSGVQLFLKGVQELIDTGVNAAMLTQIKACIQSIPGVVSIHQLRTRSHGGNVLVDAHVIVNTFISVSEGHHIGEIVHKQLLENFPEVGDVTVHIDPENDEINKPSLDLPSRPEMIAELQQHWQNLPAYQQIEKIDIHYFNGKIYLEVSWPSHAAVPSQWHEIVRVYHQHSQFLPHLASLKLLVRLE